MVTLMKTSVSKTEEINKEENDKMIKEINNRRIS